MTRALKKSRWLAWPISAVLALALTASPLRADSPSPAPDSWGAVIKYTACALGIAAAPSGIGIAAAVATCLTIFVVDVE